MLAIPAILMTLLTLTLVEAWAFQVAIKNRCPEPLITADDWQKTDQGYRHIPIDSCDSKTRAGYRVGCNVNGPSVIRVPPWLSGKNLSIDGKAARYYMYFGHHDGDHIRLAYALNICGPWHIYSEGTLSLKDIAPLFTDHVASPDVHVDELEKRMRMYFHAPLTERPHSQHTGVAVSSDGISFHSKSKDLGFSYFRVFSWQNSFYALAFGEQGLSFFRSGDPLEPFTKQKRNFSFGARHTAVIRDKNTAYAFFSRIDEELIAAGEKPDVPERILAGRVSLDQKFSQWQMNRSVEVLRPELDFKGRTCLFCPPRLDQQSNLDMNSETPMSLRKLANVGYFIRLLGNQGLGLLKLKSSICINQPT